MTPKTGIKTSQASILILISLFYIGFDINGYELGLDPDMTNVKRVINLLPIGR
jgi:hypothetical protein